MSLSRQICCAFISEYKTYRISFLWNSFVQKVLANFTSFYTDRIKECDDLITQINGATTVAEKSKIIDLLGKSARKAQEQKKAAESWKIPEWILNKFRKASSLWAKTLHAVRTCLIADILNSSEKEKEAYFLEIAAIKQQIEKYHTQININLAKPIPVPVKDLKEKRNELYYQLLDRQDPSTIIDATEYDKFPKATPSKEDLKLPEEIKVSDDFPTVYDPNYFTIFFLSELHVKSGREVKFNELLKKYQELSRHFDKKQISLLDDGFFNSPDFKEFLQANTDALDALGQKNTGATDKGANTAAENSKENNNAETKDNTSQGAPVDTNVNKEVSITKVSMYKKTPPRDSDSSVSAMEAEFESPTP